MPPVPEEQTHELLPAPAARRTRAWRPGGVAGGSGIVDPQDRWLPYALTTPVIVAIVALIFVPIGLGLWTSFTDARLLSLDQLGSGLTIDNYTALLHDRAFWHSVRATAIFSVGGVGGGLCVGLLAAIVLNRNFRGRSLARTLLILPWAVPYVVTALLWVWMYDPDYGVFNYFLTAVPFVDSGAHWLTSPSLAMVSVILVTIWKSYPFAALMFLAGLQTIPDDLYEAAEIDGASRWRQFVDITLPGLRGVTYVVILLLTIWSFANFVVIYLMTAGGPAGATEVLVVRIYQEAFRFFDAGSAFAMGGMLLAFSLLLTTFYTLTLRRVGDV